MFELIELNGIPLSIKGDYYETLILFNSTGTDNREAVVKNFAASFPVHEVIFFKSINNKNLINIKSRQPNSGDIPSWLYSKYNFLPVIHLTPELPVLSRQTIKLPFHNAVGLLQAADRRNNQLDELAVDYECCRGGLTEAEVFQLAADILKVMKCSIKNGLSGTHYRDRILGAQGHKMLSYKGITAGGEEIKKIIAYTSAVMETKSSMGVIAAAPTAGSCACLPGTLVAFSETNAIDDNLLIKALLSAGIIGVLIAGKSTFAAEECGCQAECGSSSAMSAAALVQLAGGNATQALAAASIAMQNILGMVCDPVANRVEVPCLGKNILAGMNALAASNMALAGYDQVIPFDDALLAFDQVGRMLPPELRCTGKGGLSITNSSRLLQNKLKKQRGV